MKIAADTNVLVRAVVRDDKMQAEVAAKVLRNASLVAVAVSSLCEFVWVLRSVYRFPPSDIAKAIRALLAAENVEVNRPAIDAGLAVLEEGGDFADGVIAYEGKWLGAETFVSFDKKAVATLSSVGVLAQLL
ncbi:MAG TPA: type II toxin-antitoxin system VapC family toxin [Candidatus Acidoferrum sp.]|nr:type II toxin-antitoxin system VapC family toxin [Candidatus Acidoferrum sp.]